MLNVITATHTRTRKSGETVKINEWTVGGYTLRKTEESDYTTWDVRSADRDLPAIFDVASYRAEAPVFGVNWSSCGTRSAADARAYGALLMAAADVADVFSSIVAAN